MAALADGRGEEAFAGDTVGPETETAYSAGLTLFDAPVGRNHRSGILSAEFLGNPPHILFIFRPVEGTGTVNQASSGTERRPCVGYDSALTGCTQPDVRLAPLPAGFGTFAEHPLSGAGGIYGHRVEPLAQAGEMGRVVVGDHRIADAPFADVVGKDECPAAYHFVGYYDAISAREGGVEGGFAARCGTQVEDTRPFRFCRRAQKVFDEHGGGLLYVIGPGVEQWVGRERRPFGQIASVTAPCHRDTFCGRLCLVGVPTYRYRRRAVQYAEQGVCIAGNVPAYVAYECFGQ